MSQMEKARRKLEQSTGKDRLHCRGSFRMKKSGLVSYSRRHKEEGQILDTEKDEVARSHSSASPGAWQIKPEHKLLESIQPGNVQRLVEKFRRLGEPTFHNSKKSYSRHATSKRLSVTTENHAQKKKELFISRKKSDRSKKNWMTEEKWILLTPSLFSPNELDSCSVSLSQPTAPGIQHTKTSCSSVCTKDKGDKVLPVLSCEHEVNEIVLPVECIVIENPAESHKRLTVGASKFYLPNDAANDEHIYEDVETVKTLDHPDIKNASGTQNMVPLNKTKENLQDMLQKNSAIVNDEAVNKDKPLKQQFCNSEVCSVPSEEKVSEEINAETAPSHFDTGNKQDKGAGIAVHPSNPAKDFASDDPIYEEIDLNPPIILVREQNFLSSLSLRTKNTSNGNKRENVSVTGPQCRDFCSTSSVSEDNSFTESFISDLDDYDIVYKSELTGSEFTSVNSDTQSCDLVNIHQRRYAQNVSTMSLQQPMSGSHCEICRKSQNNSGQFCGVSSQTTETSECRKKAEESASGEENIYENFEFRPPAPFMLQAPNVKCQNIPCKDAPYKDSARGEIKSNCITCKGLVAEGSHNCETGCHEQMISRDIVSESSSCRNSFTSSSYESFSSDDEYMENAPGNSGVQESQMQISEEPHIDISTEEPISKLDRIVLEIIDTERKYIERLKLINDEFRVALTTWNQEKNLIPSDAIRQMFLNIDTIYKLHSTFFLPELEDCRNKEKNRKVEDVFIKGADFLKLYAEYSGNFSTAMKLIEQWKSRVPEFNRFIQDIQRNPICQSFTLEHHMLEPILRIPRYELLLNKYLEQLPEESLEREKSLKAVQKVNAAASHCNNFIGSMEKHRKVMDVQQSLWSKVDLMTPSRELIMDGRMKVTQQQQKDEDKHLFLFNDTLLVCKIFPLGITPPYKMTLQLDIDGMQVVDRRMEETAETFFVISKQGYLEMHPGSMEEKERWISALNAVITKHVALEKTRHNSTGSQNPSYQRQKSIPGTQAPIWIKDPQANRCMQCDENFNAIRRRHHCRACGIVVCGKCSSKEAPLAYDSFSQQHRVCDKCFTEILSSFKDDNESETKVRHSLLRNVSRLSRTNDPDSGCRTSIFFILPCDEKSPSYSDSSEEQKKLTSSLEAIIETDTESKDSQEQVT